MESILVILSNSCRIKYRETERGKTNLSIAFQGPPDCMFDEVDPFLVSQSSNDSYHGQISLFQPKSFLQSFFGSLFAFDNIF